ncbi:unnamed protein product [Cunninghamella blakesleeana]
MVDSVSSSSIHSVNDILQSSLLKRRQWKNKKPIEMNQKKNTTTTSAMTNNDNTNTNNNDDDDDRIIELNQQVDQFTLTPPPTPSSIPLSVHSNDNENKPSDRFIFNKPEYNQHYHKTHFNHLQRHTSLFKDFKQLFKKSQFNHYFHHQKSTDTLASSASSDYSFANEFNKDLESKYGSWGSFVGKGSGGSVRIIHRATDNKTFAVKQFRKRGKHESEKKYIKTVTAEFCIGSALHHENIIETLDIIQEHHLFYEIMEYAPIDLFNVVTQTKVSHPQINCYWRQLLNGVSYLQEMGIGHRDLKLENVVMNDQGILKIIDFGMATIVKYPGSSIIKPSTGVCGSDPYIAPEVYTQDSYDSFLTDIWSCGIILTCMMINKFPWRIAIPKTDENFQFYLHNKNALLSYIPRYARVVLANVLEPNPDQRWTIDTLLSNKWVASIDHCTSQHHCLSHHPYYKEDATSFSIASNSKSLK